MTETHRFLNQPVKVLKHLHWDILQIFHELKSALERLDKSQSYLSVGIDGWGADYGLIDRKGRLVGNVHHYRDPRTEHIVEELCKKMPPHALFLSTASDLKRHYTLCQLYSQVISDDPFLKSADKLLFIPDLISYLFTGSVIAESTIAATSQLLSSSGDAWNHDLLALLGIRKTLFPPLVPPRTNLGPMLPAYKAETGFGQLSFVAVSGHDTASALASISSLHSQSAFVSTGTTIVVGSETEEPFVNDATFEYGFKNCRGTEGVNLLLRNNTGFWILQQCKRIWEQRYSVSFASLSREARTIKAGPSVFDPESSEFENPDNMAESIRNYALRTHQAPPQTRADYTRSIYTSLALQIRWCIAGLEAVIDKSIDCLHLIGGGANDSFFCELVTDCTGLPLYAGPTEATILGNLMVQLQAAGEVSSLHQIREVVRRSTPMLEYVPSKESGDEFSELYTRFVCYKELQGSELRI